MKKLVLYLIAFSLTSATFAVDRVWVGAGAGGAGTDFNTMSNWSPSTGSLGPADNLTLTLTTAGVTISLSSDVTVNNISLTVESNTANSCLPSASTYTYLDVNGNVLTINGTADFGGVDSWTYYFLCIFPVTTYRDYVVLDAAGTNDGYVFNGATTMSSSNGGTWMMADAVGGFFKFMDDVTFGNMAITSPAVEPYFVFDKPAASGTQTVTFNLSSYLIPQAVVVGLDNTPTVEFAGSNPDRFGVYDGNFTVKDGATIDIGNGSMDSYVMSGDFSLGANSTLKIGGTQSFPGDNLLESICGCGADFASYTLDPTSTIIYDGTNQDVKGGLTYGHLKLENAGTKTSQSNFSIKGDVTNNVTWNDGNDVHTFNGSTAQVIKGATSPTTFYDVVINKSNTLTSNINLVVENELQLDAGTFLVDGETITLENEVDINGGTLQVTSGTITHDEDSNTDFDQDGGTFDIDGGTVNIGVIASQGNADYNLDGGTLDMSNGTLNIADELDMDGGAFNQSGGTINIKAHTGTGDGTAASKFDVSSGTVNITNGTINLLGAYDNSVTYPAMDYNPTSSTITGGTIIATETGTNDEPFYIQTNGNALNNFTVDKSATPATATIWSEGFEDLSAGDESDGGATSWSTACTGGSPCGLNDGNGSDYFEVRSSSNLTGNNLYRGRDMDNEAKWTSGLITISGYTNVSGSVDLRESGYDNGADYIRVYYSLDGGGETLLTSGNQSGGFGTATATFSGLTGTTIQIFVYMMNNGGNDHGEFDEVTVTGDASAAGLVYLADDLDIENDLSIISQGGIDVTASNRQINIAGNWSNASTATDPFIERDGTVVFDGTSAQQISHSTTETFYGLTINNSSNEVTLSSDVAISNLLTLTAGNIITSADDLLTINDAATTTSGSAASFVDGPLKKIGNDNNFTFPVGDAGIWARAQMRDIANFDDATEFTCQYFRSPSPNETDLDAAIDHVSAIEYWDLSRTLDTGDDAECNVRLFWEDETSSQITDMADLTLSHYNSVTSEWEDHGGVGVDLGANGYVTTTVVLSNFSPLAFASKGGANPLPIELISFKAHLNGNQVDLMWATASEKNNAYFTIERSSNGRTFESILKIEGAGNSTSEIEYFDIDYEPLNGISYYRLKQIDFDGKFSYSQVVPVEYKEDGSPGIGIFSVDHEMKVFPNPNDGKHINVELTGFNPEEEVLMIVRDMAGREYYSKVVLTDVEGHVISGIDPSQKLPAGNYLIIGSEHNHLYSRKLIVVK